MRKTRPNPTDLPRVLGELRETGYTSRSVKIEIRDNLVRRLEEGPRELFPGIIGYEKTVLPQVLNALLSRHDLILLGLRGQAKTRLARAIHVLLDERIPIIQGSALNEDPLAPITPESRRRAEELGDDLPIEWLDRAARVQEKLATPDITMADLLGDIDPIKAATEKRDLMDPEVIQYGLIPRTNRGIMIINELPDLPTRIQVGLFNLLEEKDVQIRGFPLRLPLDLLFVFTANPEDYTSRGRIVTPLRDRIRSQIHTHYPLSLEEGLLITEQESWTKRGSKAQVHVPRFMKEAIEEIAIQARTSAFVDQSSGVSARVTISLLENTISNAERRALLSGAQGVCARPSDLHAALPGLSGKVELVYEGEQEGPLAVGRHLLGKGLKVVFDRYLEDPYKDSGKGKSSPYDGILTWFKQGGLVRLSEDSSDEAAHQELTKLPGLLELARVRMKTHNLHEEASAMELILEGLHQASLVARRSEPGAMEYRDQLGEMLSDLGKT